MENKDEEKLMLEEPVSPHGECLNSSVISISVLAVLEFEIPIDESYTISLALDFLSLNPIFSSIMVNDTKGKRKWKKVEVNVEEHIFVPTLPSNLSFELNNDTYFNEYMTNLALKELPQNKPLWEIHIIKYPTSNAIGTLIFKYHHSLGDGYSIMSLLFSRITRADDPSLPLTFPSRKFSKRSEHLLSCFSRVFSSAMNSVLDFGWSVIKSSVLEDDLTPIRSGGDGVEFRPISLWTMSFSLRRIKQIKSKLGVTVNDVITGMILLGIRLYMQETCPDSTRSNSTALVLLNTRMFGNYKSVEDLLKPNSDVQWGNQIAFLHIDIPKMIDKSEPSNPLQFITAAHKLIIKKRNSSAVFLIDKLLTMLKKFRGPEEAAKYVYNTLKYSSLSISNMIGPNEKMALRGHPIKGIYFTSLGAPQSLMISIISYMENLRISFGTEKEFIDEEKLKTCMEKAFEKIYKAALDVST